MISRETLQDLKINIFHGIGVSLEIMHATFVSATFCQLTERSTHEKTYSTYEVGVGGGEGGVGSDILSMFRQVGSGSRKVTRATTVLWNINCRQWQN